VGHKTLTQSALTWMCFVLAGGKRVGVNPKVNNMVQGYEFARHDLILISDCGLRSKSVVAVSLRYTRAASSPHSRSHRPDHEGLDWQTTSNMSRS